jgi:hypothetical protein
MMIFLVHYNYYLQVLALRVKLGVDDVMGDHGEGGEEEG